MSQEQASYLANITAKLAHASNRDMGVVGLNMQQILTSWQGIDIKELIKSVPLIGKFLQDERRKAGSNEDIYAFVRSNPQAFFRALEEFNKMVKISPVAMARGQIALNRENFFLKLEKLFEPVAKRMADINTKLYDILGDVAEEFFSNQNLDNVDSILDNFQKASKTLLEAAAKFGNAAINVGSWMAENTWTTTAGIYALFGKGPLTLKVAAIVAGSIIDQSKKVQDKIDDNRAKDFFASSDAKKFTYDLLGWRYNDQTKNKFFNLIQTEKGETLRNIVLDAWDNKELEKDTYYDIKRTNKAISDIQKEDGVSPSLSAISMGNQMMFQSRYRIPGFDKYKVQRDYSKEAIVESEKLLPEIEAKGEDSIKSLTDSFDTQSVGASDAQTIRGMSGTTRALVINFNREIVSMPTTINANDVADIKQQLEPAIEDMIVRGLTIALNNSTRMI